MTSAVSAVTSAISNVVDPIGSAIPGNLLGSIGNGMGQDLGSIAQGIASAIPNIPIADQSQLQTQINNNQNLASENFAYEQGAQGQANTALGNTQSAINQSQGSINNAQGAVSNAQQVNQGPNSNVNSAIGLTAQTAAGGGAAQQAANATLQQGTNAAIAGQQAIANSGNLSQMIGGQRTAMQNAANLQEQNALNSAQLQAGLATTAQGQYTGAAAQQASQASTNASLQQSQTAAQQQQAAQQSGLYNTAQGAATNYAGAANTAAGNALTGQTNALGIQQGALSQSGQNQAMAVGGMLNALGGAGMAALSDENSKTNISYASGPNAGQIYPGSDTENTTNNLNNPSTYSSTPTMLSMGDPSPPQYGPNPMIASSIPVYGQSAPNGSQGQAPTPNTNSGKQQKNPNIFSLGSSIGLQWRGIPLSSDKHGKKDIESQSDNKVKSFLDALDPVSFKYKQADGQMGKTPGEHLGVIAQQVEKAPHGKSMIIDTPQGKAIDSPSAIGALLAAATDINHRVSSLEEYFKSRKEKK